MLKKLLYVMAQIGGTVLFSPIYFLLAVLLAPDKECRALSCLSQFMIVMSIVLVSSFISSFLLLLKINKKIG